MMTKTEFMCSILDYKMALDENLPADQQNIDDIEEDRDPFDGDWFTDEGERQDTNPNENENNRT